MKAEKTINLILQILSKLSAFHSRETDVYKKLDELLNEAIYSIYGRSMICKADLFQIGEVILEYIEMGAINSTHLFGLDEMIIFSFYTLNRHRYKRVADLGANLGLHSIILGKLGYIVSAYEPDNTHLSIIKKNLARNNVENNVQIYPYAVSVEDGAHKFVRVLGNTTSSHLLGSKSQAYGQLDTVSVRTTNFKNILTSNDLLKIDVEGHEGDIICSTQENNWLSCDAIIEVGNESNAQRIYEHFKSTKIKLFSQKTGWSQVKDIKQVPKSYKDGSLFITSKENMPWN